MKKVTTAFILGAGLGTRLRPLTDTCPKPLLPVCDRPMITYVFEHLVRAGIRRFIVNTHHCSEVYVRFFPNHTWQGLPLVFRHEPLLLGTAGGLKNVEDLIGNETFLLHSGDVLTNLPIDALLDFHRTHDSEISLALRTRPGIETVGVDPGGRIGDVGRSPSRSDLAYHDYANVAVIEPAFMRRIPDSKPRELATIWSQMAREHGSLFGLPLNQGYWFNVGTLEEYERLKGAQEFPPLGNKKT